MLTLGRIMCGWICDRSWSDPLKIYNGALIIGGTATVACVWMKLYVLQAIYAAIFGLCIGEFGPDLFRDRRLSDCNYCRLH